MSFARVLPSLASSSGRFFSTSSTYLSPPSFNKPPVFILKNSTVFPFGIPSNEDTSKALFTNLSWTISHSDAWAILSPSSSSTIKQNLISTVLAQTRFVPSHSGSHPILASLPLRARSPDEGSEEEGRLATVEDIIQLVSFKTRLSSSGSGFEDYTARYYFIREEDKLTVRQHLKKSMPYFKPEFNNEGKERDYIFEAAKSLEMESFLDLPIVTLSNGQTRRIRIVRAILARPELIILEEPFTGLDTSSRTLLVSLLDNLQSTQSPRVLLVLRPQDPLPNFISHIALVAPDNSIQFGTTSTILSTSDAQELISEGTREREKAEERRRKRLEGKNEKKVEGKTLVELKGVNVSYSDRKVLIDINWSIREGDRWVLAGHNGSGKSTLLSLILGDHPRSFMEDISLFGKPRIQQATSTIQENVGHISPEIYNAFPRKFGPASLTVEDAIMTGFNSIYCYRKPTDDQKSRFKSFLEDFNHPLYISSYLSLEFASLPPSEQSLTLLFRALVKRPALLVLDESFSFMPKGMVDFVKNYLDNKLGKHQAVIFISHFEEEIPNSMTRTLMLEHGKIKQKN